MQVTRVAQVGEAPGVAGNSGTVFSGRSEKVVALSPAGERAAQRGLGEGPRGAQAWWTPLPAPASIPRRPGWGASAALPAGRCSVSADAAGVSDPLIHLPRGLSTGGMRGHNGPAAPGGRRTHLLPPRRPHCLSAVRGVLGWGQSAAVGITPRRFTSSKPKGIFS